MIEDGHPDGHWVLLLFCDELAPFVPILIPIVGTIFGFPINRLGIKRGQNPRKEFQKGNKRKKEGKRKEFNSQSAQIVYSL
jgi:hypothetical protein